MSIYDDLTDLEEELDSQCEGGVSDDSAEMFQDDGKIVVASVSSAGEWISVDADSAVEIEE